MGVTLHPFQRNDAEAYAAAEFRVTDLDNATLQYARDGLRNLPDELAKRLADLVMEERKAELLAAITPELIAEAIQKAVTEIGSKLIFEHVRKTGAR